MGAFCVFGVSKTACKLAAERRTPSFEGEGLGRRELSIAEWAARRDVLAVKLYETTERAERISPEFDAPQFCRDWLDVAGDDVRMTSIMVRGPKFDGGGKPILRKGVQVMAWVEFKHVGQFKAVPA